MVEAKRFAKRWQVQCESGKTKVYDMRNWMDETAIGVAIN